MATYTFTIFTATYNRAGTLPRVYDSLKSQTFRDFEWLIVDDGSSDATGELVKDWQNKAQFPIRYVWQENAGKQEAFNQGVQEAHGELFLSIDSDDACVPEALERFNFHWREIQSLPAPEAASFSAVTGLCRDQGGSLIGSRFPQDSIASDSNEMHYRYKVGGDKWGFQKTSILREFPFPKVADGSFVPEGVVWNAIGRKYKTRYINEPLLIVWTGHRDRLTVTNYKAFSGKLGHALWHREVLNNNLGFFRFAPMSFAQSAAHYTRFSLHGGVSLKRQFSDLKGLGPRLLWTAALPLGILVYIKDRARMRTAR